MPRKLRILCLHGSKQCGELFSQRIEPLVARLKSEWPGCQFDFPDGPIEMPLEDGQTVPMRRWWEGSEPVDADTQFMRKLLSDGRYHGVIGFSQGAAAACLLASLDGGALLKFAIVAGGYACKHVRQGGLVRGVQTMHIAGDKDDCVPIQASEQCASLFVGSIVRRHKKSHIFPCAGTDVTAYLRFVQEACRSLPQEAEEEDAGEGEAAVVGVASEELSEEFEAMEAIFGEEIKIVADGGRCTVTLGEGTDATLGLVFPQGYPEHVPGIVLRGCGAAKQELAQLLRAEAEKNVGMGMIYQLVTAAREWLGERGGLPAIALSSASIHGDPPRASDPAAAQASACAVGEDEPPPSMQADVDDSALFLESSQHAAQLDGDVSGATGRKGMWRVVVGLVGKPSAGKSTFFNAACDPDSPAKEAKIGAFPFTTIDPNVGDGFFSVLCPSVAEGLKSSPAYGFAGEMQRKIPVTIKDVAGLVPGAYTGLGKGNAFLNELCDADVLIHVVDASGTTSEGGHSLGGTSEQPSNARAESDGDSEGQNGAGNLESQTGQWGSPAGDVLWVRREIHMWIYTNVRTKWGKVVRKPEHVFGLFSGYHATRDIIAASLARCGMSEKKMATDGFASWGPKELHLLIANFLRIRFPMVLALNKADLPSAAGHIESIKTKHPGELCVPVSAHTEMQLCKWRRAGLVQYESASGKAEVVQEAARALDDGNRDKFEKGWGQVAGVLTTLGGTGVLSALNTAVMARSPVIMYPVADTDTCQCIGDGAVLRDAIVMRPTSTIADVYEALKTLKLATGDFIRAEARLRNGGGKRPLRKDEQVSDEVSILRVMTNKKITWQKSAGPER